MGPNEMREVLARAEAIQSGQALRLEDSGEVEALVEAASEAGLSREAVLQALRERLLACAPLAAGETAFAKSADGHSYVANVEEVREHSVIVRFVRGGTAEVRQSDLVRFSPTPGLQIQANYPSWGWWPSTVLGYDEKSMTVSVSDNMGSEYKLPISEVRMPRPKSRSELAWQRIYVGAGIFAAGIGMGLLIFRFLQR